MNHRKVKVAIVHGPHFSPFRPEIRYFRSAVLFFLTSIYSKNKPTHSFSFNWRFFYMRSDRSRCSLILFQNFYCLPSVPSNLEVIQPSAFYLDFLWLRKTRPLTSIPNFICNHRNAIPVNVYCQIFSWSSRLRVTSALDVEIVWPPALMHTSTFVNLWSFTIVQRFYNAF